MQRAPALIFFGFTIAVAGVVPSGSAQDNESPSTWKAPPEAAEAENPYPATPEILEEGKMLFNQQCSPCHGSSGKGDGPAGQYLGKPLPNFTRPGFQDQSDGALFWKLSKGNAPMPTFEEILSEKQRWILVGYLRTFLASEQQGGTK